MSLKEEIAKKAKEIKDTAFNIEDIDFIPSIYTTHPNLTFGCTGVRLPVTVLYIDMRKSTELLNDKKRNVVAKVHMVYYHAIIKVVNSCEGEVRSFNGDSLLVFFLGQSFETINKAVRCAFKIRYALTSIVNGVLKEYTKIDFGIGVDCGDVIATKVGVGGDKDNKDLVWIGNAVNRATVISDQCKEPNYVGISGTVYSKLDDKLKYYEAPIRTSSSLLYELTKKNVWSQSYLTYNGSSEIIYKSQCIIEFK